MLPKESVEGFSRGGGKDRLYRFWGVGTSKVLWSGGDVGIVYRV